MKKLREFKQAIKRRYGVEKIIFFGSRAAGNYRKYSDIDLILISKKFRGKSFLKRPLGLHFYWNLGYPVDFICYAPEEFEKLKKGITLVSQALREGIEI
ncbi:MAG: nucleotidyltransferase domain-containing protein [Candidatus Aenigmarchaeota archaeon]|nr:nucleotidyltransferase domain-containing protein [Candidatus Aenigmarchaeota archaeon]